MVRIQLILYRCQPREANAGFRSYTTIQCSGHLDASMFRGGGWEERLGVDWRRNIAAALIYTGPGLYLDDLSCSCQATIHLLLYLNCIYVMDTSKKQDAAVQNYEPRSHKRVPLGESVCSNIMRSSAWLLTGNNRYLNNTCTPSSVLIVL